MWTGEQSLEDAFRNLAAFRRNIRRHVVWLCLWTLGCVSVGAAYVQIITPEYIASVRVILQPRYIAFDPSEEVRRSHQIELDGAQTETELRVIRSEQVLRYVFGQLHLSDDHDLRSAHIGFWSDLFALLHRIAVSEPTDDEQAELYDRFVSRVRTQRFELSYVFDISYVASTPKMAVRVANAIASAYIRRRILASAGAQAQAQTLNQKQRIAEILAQVQATSDAVGQGAIPTSNPPDADVRVISGAIEPSAKAYPSLVLLLIVAGTFGLVTGILGLSLLGGRGAPPA